MKGRKENEEKMLKRIKKVFKTSPKYIEEYYYTLNDKSYTTKYAYITYILDFLEFLKTEMNLNVKDIECFRKVRTSNINYYISTLGEISNGFKLTKLYAIKSFFDYLLNDDYVSSNPCDKVSKPKNKVEYKITSLTKDEIDVVKHNILTGCDNTIDQKQHKEWYKRDYAIIMLGLSLGLRVTSLSEINVEDIDFDNKEIKIIEKGNKVRSVNFSKNIEVVLKDWLADRYYILCGEKGKTDALFISNHKTRISARTISRIVKKYTYNIDKHITPHKLRSTCATNVYNKTGDIYLTADVLGHSNIANTRRYAQISEERKRKAASAMDDILF